ncbi:MAG: DMT family transporter [Rhizobiaceae bacterium]
MNLTLKASLSIAAGAGFWGLFWIPLRYLDANGVTGLWSVAMALASGAVFSIPAALYWGQSGLKLSRGMITIGLGIGCSAVLYFAGVVLSDVIRVIFLFYLLPIWATLTAWMIFGERIRAMQLASIALALAGLWLLLGGDGGLPLPRNLGDWFGLAAGLLWGLSLTLIKGNPGLDPFANSAAPFVIGAPIAIGLGALIHIAAPDAGQALPEADAMLAMLPVSLLFGALLLWPAMLGQVWGARHVSAPTAALLTMTEILVATVSAWLLIGSSLTPLSLLGGLIIVLAAIIDLVSGYRANRPAAS